MNTQRNKFPRGMNPILRYSAISLLLLISLVYVGFALYLASNETEMVFSGAGGSNQESIIPSPDSSFPWDSLSVLDKEGTPVFLLESVQENASESPWVIFFHGNALPIGHPENVSRYKILKDIGFNVLAVEYRGFGKSTEIAIPSELGIYQDALAGWAYLSDSLDVDPHQIVVYGWSLGAAVATYITSVNRPAGLITESAFTTITAIGQDMYPWFPIELIMRNEFNNLRRASELTIPWLIFHSRDDSTVPFSHAQQLNKSADHSVLVELTGGHRPVSNNPRLASEYMYRFTNKLFGSTESRDPVTADL